MELRASTREPRLPASCQNLNSAREVELEVSGYIYRLWGVGIFVEVALVPSVLPTFLMLTMVKSTCRLLFPGECMSHYACLDTSV